MDIQKYNQRLLAILGTLSIAALVIILLMIGVFFVVELVDNISRNNARDNSLMVEHKDDAEIKLRKQEITFYNPKLIDTLSSTYLIPVSQVNLQNPEDFHEVAKESYDLGLSKMSSSRRMGYRHTGTFNNLIIYNQLANEKKLVFNEKINISSYQYFNVNETLFLFIKGSKIDSNKNGKLDDDDLESFFAYNIFSQELQEITFTEMGLIDYHLTIASDEIILRFAKDKNGDGEIDQYREPVILKSLRLESKTIKDLIEDTMVNQIQHLID